MEGTLPPLSQQLSPTLEAWTLTWKLSVKAETAFHEEMVGLRQAVWFQGPGDQV